MLVDRIDAEYSDKAKPSLFERCLVTGVVAAPLGAYLTAVHGPYGWDV